MSLVCKLESNAVFAILFDGGNDSNSHLYPIIVVYFYDDEETY